MAAKSARKKAPAPPAKLSAAAAARWRDVVRDRPGPFDLELLANYCLVWVRWQEAEAAISKAGVLIRTQQGRAVPNPYLAVSKQASRDVMALEARLGLAGPPDSGDPGASDRLLNRRDLAALFGVHMQTVTKWERDGLPVAQRGRKGRASLYREGQVRAWLTAREEAAKTGAGVDVAAARAAKDTWQAKLAEQAYLVRSRSLLPAEEVARMWAAEVLAIRTIILGSYATATDKVLRAATVDGRAGVERELMAIADAALRELADPDRPVAAGVA